ncbi:hypothetical protein [Streptomyces sp. NPDC047043]|uniref:hypothetical protein n=1 Tax=Streptomyces sp. NPDC047043 TaxID=3154497 RepID=UPI0033DECC13
MGTPSTLRAAQNPTPGPSCPTAAPAVKSISSAGSTWMVRPAYAIVAKTAL